METKKLGQTDIQVPVIGMGTWNLTPPDEYAPANLDERQVISSLRFGIENGLTHIDTAENYGGGLSEILIGKAIKGIDRSRLFIASKVDPPHYSRAGVREALRTSLKRMETDYLDLYMMHWPNNMETVRETMSEMEKLVDEGLIRFIGVSNFSVREMKQARSALTRNRIVSNQVKYNILDRYIEDELLPFAEKEGITITAYSPFDTGNLFDRMGSGNDITRRLADKYHRTPAQICLNWVITKKPVIAIAKSTRTQHLSENAGAAGWRMEQSDYEALSKATRMAAIAE